MDIPIGIGGTVHHFNSEDFGSMSFGEMCKPVVGVHSSPTVPNSDIPDRPIDDTTIYDCRATGNGVLPVAGRVLLRPGVRLGSGRTLSEVVSNASEGFLLREKSMRKALVRDAGRAILEILTVGGLCFAVACVAFRLVMN